MDIYQKSMETLKKIIRGQKKFNFEIALIGGWAVYCYNPYMKSKDIDFLIKKGDFWRLKGFLDSLGFRQTVSKPLEKKGFALLINEDKVELDVYDERIGNFSVDEVFEKKMFSIRKFENIPVNVVTPDLLLTLKLISASERLGTERGIKDQSDILALLEKFYDTIDFSFIFSNVDKETVREVLSVVLSDYKRIKNTYPMGFIRFQKIKRSVLKRVLS